MLRSSSSFCFFFFFRHASDPGGMYRWAPFFLCLGSSLITLEWTQGVCEDDVLAFIHRSALPRRRRRRRGKGEKKQRRRKKTKRRRKEEERRKKKEERR